MSSNKISRRVFLGGSAALGSVVSLTVLGCGGKKAFTCTDEAGLAAGDKTARTNAKYVDKATDAAKRCDGCALYEPAAEGQCGKCKAIKGPIHPEGTCNLWVKKALAAAPGDNPERRRGAARHLGNTMVGFFGCRL